MMSEADYSMNMKEFNGLFRRQWQLRDFFLPAFVIEENLVKAPNSGYSQDGTGAIVH